MRAYDMSRYRPSGEPTPPSPQQPPSSQADSYSQVTKTHRVMTLADHISVRDKRESEKQMQHIEYLLCTPTHCM